MVQQPDTIETNIPYLKPEQVDDIREAAYDGSHGARDDAIVTLLYDTGLRRSELSQLDTDMLDLEERQLRIPGRIQKGYPNSNNPKAATFELDPAGTLDTVRTLRSYLDSRDDTHAALFPSRKSARITGKGVNDVVKRLSVYADVRPYTSEGRGPPEDISAHTLRHSLPWRMLHAEEGNTFYDVRNRLRHSSIATTEKRYDHFDTI